MPNPEGLTPDTPIGELLPLVKRIAYHLMSRLPASVEVDDLIQAGLIGLMEAIERYDDSQGAQFETYATQRIRGAMLDELRQADWASRSMRRDARRIENAIHVLQQRLGRPPSDGEIAAELNLPIGEYHALLNETRGLQLLYYEDLSEDDAFLERFAENDGKTPLEILAGEDFRRALAEAIAALPEREKLLMSLYYEHDMNFKEIGAVLNVTESRVCQLHSQAIARLRSRLRDWIKD